jgi:hypothetical protein
MNCDMTLPKYRVLSRSTQCCRDLWIAARSCSSPEGCWFQPADVPTKRAGIGDGFGAPEPWRRRARGSKF